MRIRHCIAVLFLASLCLAGCGKSAPDQAKGSPDKSIPEHPEGSTIKFATGYTCPGRRNLVVLYPDGYDLYEAGNSSIIIDLGKDQYVTFYNTGYDEIPISCFPSQMKDQELLARLKDAGVPTRLDKGKALCKASDAKAHTLIPEKTDWVRTIKRGPVTYAGNSVQLKQVPSINGISQGYGLDGDTTLDAQSGGLMLVDPRNTQYLQYRLVGSLEQMKASADGTVLKGIL